jgi:hypothetical protein
MNAVSTTPTIPTTLPPIVCTSWCQDGTGHTDAWHPDDQLCIGELQRIPLSLYPLVRLDDGVMSMDWAEVQLVNSHNRTKVNLEVSDKTARLTPQEALEVGRTLIAAAETAIEAQNEVTASAVYDAFAEAHAAGAERR